MTAHARPFHEPAENEFLRFDEPKAAPPHLTTVSTLIAAMLGTIEHGIVRAKEHGLEDELRAIFERNFPTVMPPAVPDVTPPEPLATTPTRRALNLLDPSQVDLLFGLLSCIQALDEHARRAKADSPAQKRDTACRDLLRRLSEDLKAGAVTYASREAKQ